MNYTGKQESCKMCNVCTYNIYFVMRQFIKKNTITILAA